MAWNGFIASWSLIVVADESGFRQFAVFRKHDAIRRAWPTFGLRPRCERGTDCVGAVRFEVGSTPHRIACQTEGDSALRERESTRASEQLRVHPAAEFIRAARAAVVAEGVLAIEGTVARAGEAMAPANSPTASVTPRRASRERSTLSAFESAAERAEAPAEFAGGLVLRSLLEEARDERRAKVVRQRGEFFVQYAEQVVEVGPGASFRRAGVLAPCSCHQLFRGAPRAGGRQDPRGARRRTATRRSEGGFRRAGWIACQYEKHGLECVFREVAVADGPLAHAVHAARRAVTSCSNAGWSRSSVNPRQK